MKLAFALFFSVFFALTAFNASAGILTVTNTNDAGPGSLRFMIINSSSKDVINFAPNLSGATIKLLTSITINKDTLTIDGSGLAKRPIITCDTNLAVKVEGRGVITLINLQFTNNSGGAVFGGVVRNCLFLNNHVLRSRANSCCDNAKVENCIFIGNKGIRGGACYGSYYISDSYFEGNEATEDGGACYGGYSLLNCYFKNNKAKKGGAVFNYPYRIISNCTFVGNEAELGGAVYFETKDIYSRTTYINNTFIFNKAQSAGGAIYLGGTGIDRCRIYHCTFVKNQAGKEGGAIKSLRNKSDALGNCLFAENEAGEKGMDISGEVASVGGNLVSISGGSEGWKNGKDILGSISNPINPLLNDSLRCGNQLYISFKLGSPALGTGIKELDTLFKDFCRDICKRERPINCIDIGSYQQSTCSSAVSLGNCQYTSRALFAQNESFSLYPNPTASRVKVRLSVPPVGLSAEVYDLTGRQLLSQPLTDPETEIRTESLPSGVYLLKIGDRTAKLIKE